MAKKDPFITNQMDNRALIHFGIVGLHDENLRQFAARSDLCITFTRWKEREKDKKVQRVERAKRNLNFLNYIKYH